MDTTLAISFQLMTLFGALHPHPYGSRPATCRVLWWDRHKLFLPSLPICLQPPPLIPCPCLIGYSALHRYLTSEFSRQWLF